MALSIFFLASSRCSAGDPVSLGCDAEDRPLVISDGRRAMLELMCLAGMLTQIHVAAVVSKAWK